MLTSILPVHDLVRVAPRAIAGIGECFTEFFGQTGVVRLELRNIPTLALDHAVHVAGNLFASGRQDDEDLLRVELLLALRLLVFRALTHQTPRIPTALPFF